MKDFSLADKNFPIFHSDFNLFSLLASPHFLFHSWKNVLYEFDDNFLSRLPAFRRFSWKREKKNVVDETEKFTVETLKKVREN